jgi:hypothetical protein
VTGIDELKLANQPQVTEKPIRQCSFCTKFLCLCVNEMKMSDKYSFPDELVVEPVDKDAAHLPSPSQLKRKIILKVSY